MKYQPHALVISRGKYPNGDATAIRQHFIAKLLLVNNYTVTVVSESSPHEPLEGCYDSINYICYSGDIVNFNQFICDYLIQIREIPTLIFLNEVPLPAFLYVKHFALKHNIFLYHDCVDWFSLDMVRHQSQFTLKTVMMFAAYVQKNLLNYLIINNMRVVCVSTFLETYFKHKSICPYYLPIVMNAQEFDFPSFSSIETLRVAYAGNPSGRDYLASIISGVACLSHLEKKRSEFLLYGVSKEELVSLCNLDRETMNILPIHAKGRVSRSEVLDGLLKADFTILIRSSTARYAKAGFPTKVVESLMSSTPVICNMTSDLGMYLTDGYNCIEVKDESPEEIAKALRRALALTPEEKDQMKKNARKTAEENFDYRLYVESFGKFIRNEE